MSHLDPKSLELLEFERVLERVARHARTPMGREHVHALRPVTDLAEARARQQETSQLRRLIEDGGEAARIPLDVPDVRASVRRAGAGGALGGEELAGIARACQELSRLRQYLQGWAVPDGPAPALAPLLDRVGDFGELAAAIRRAVDDDGRVVDHASPELAAIRARLRKAVERVQEALQRLVHSPVGRRALQEPIVTLRAGRYVVPVRQEHRDLVPGIVHDASASGATLFVEPLSVVEANNAVRTEQSREQAEVERVLAELSRQVGRQAAQLAEALDAAGELDAACARARYSLEVSGSEPALNRRGRVRLEQARHPLLEGHVVPIDVNLDVDFRVLVITGPNTGGKTVAMKTVGLLCAMGMAGLHVPAAPGSEVAVWDEVWIDVGDRQSVVENLSTFSSHLTRILPILQRAGPQTLVLLDELGAGTDPEEGAALGGAVLEHLRQVGARVIATTHLGELKVMAHLTPGMANASVAFDVETLSPTYRLVTGAPGPSQALAIAARLGLPRSILEDARRRLGSERLRADRLIADLQGALEAARAQQDQAARDREEAARLREEARRVLGQLQARRARYLASAQEELSAWLRSIRREADAILQEMREAARAGQIREVQRLREALATLKSRAEAGLDRFAPDPEALSPLPEASALALQSARGEGAPQPDGAPADGSIDRGPTASGRRAAPQAGARVWVVPLSSYGRVAGEVDDDGYVWVQVGAVRTRLALDRLLVVAEGGTEAASAEAIAPEPQGTGPAARELGCRKAADLPSQLDLRGCSAEEALARLDKYLDDCLLAGARRVRIIHGVGTGVLREAVRGRLRTAPGVRAFFAAAPHEGGDGATVIEFD